MQIQCDGYANTANTWQKHPSCLRSFCRSGLEAPIDPIRVRVTTSTALRFIFPKGGTPWHDSTTIYLQLGSIRLYPPCVVD